MRATAPRGGFRALSRSVPRALLSAGAVAAVSLAASPAALANGRFPRADQLIAVPGQPDTLVLRATFGLLVSRDAGATWGWVCEQAVGISGEEDPALAALAGGTLLAGLSSGLAESSDPFCAWQSRGLSATPLEVVDASVRPLDPRAAVLLAWRRVETGNAFGYASEFYATSDAGASWQAYGTGIDENVLVLTLDVAASDPRRLYASGIRPAARTAALFVSVDEGQTWSERPAPFDSPREQGLYIGGVDPLDAERVYLRTSGATSSRLLLTRDAGLSFEQVFAGRSLLGFALSADASEVYVGGPENGLWAAARADLAFEQRSTVPILCLMSSGPLLYACSNELTGFALGASTDGGRQFVAKLRLSELRGAIACPESSSAGSCPAEWPAIAARLGAAAESSGGGNAGASAGPAEAAGGGAGSAAPGPQSEGGCAFAAPRALRMSSVGLCAGLGWAVVVRRRRAQR